MGNDTEPSIIMNGITSSVQGHNTGTSGKVMIIGAGRSQYSGSSSGRQLSH